MSGVFTTAVADADIDGLATLLYRVVDGAPSLDQVPPAVRPLVERWLAKDPAQRPTTQGLLAIFVRHYAPGIGTRVGCNTCGSRSYIPVT